MKQFRLEEELIKILEELSKETGKSQTQLIEEAILYMYQHKQHNNLQLEIYKQENEKLKIVINTLQIALTEKDNKYEDLKKTYTQMYEDMKTQYEKRIEELKQINKESKKKWWNLLFKN